MTPYKTPSTKKIKKETKDKKIENTQDTGISKKSMNIMNSFINLLYSLKKLINNNV